MPTYLTDGRPNTPLYEILRGWNARWEVDRVLTRLDLRFGEGHSDLLNTTWARLESEFGIACIPFCPPATEEPLESLTGPARREREDYLIWKGDIGPGERLVAMETKHRLR